MKTIHLIMISMLIATTCLAGNKKKQEDYYFDKKYPCSKYSLEKDSIVLERWIFEVNKIKSNKKPQETAIFIYSRLRMDVQAKMKIKSIIVERHFKGVSTPREPVFHPNIQPLDDRLILVEEKKKQETIYILKKEGGRTLKMKGYYFAISSDGNYVYSKTKDEKSFYILNLDREWTKQISILPKEELDFYEPQESERL